MTKAKKKARKPRNHAVSKATEVSNKADFDDSASYISRQDRKSVATSTEIRHLRPADLITISQACELLDVSRSTLDRHSKTGAIPGRVKLLGRVAYHRPTLEVWFDAQVNLTL